MELDSRIDEPEHDGEKQKEYEEEKMNLQDTAEDFVVHLGHSLGLPLCPITIGSSSCKALLDSGSNFSFISESLCNNEGLTVVPSSHVVHGLGGQGILALGVAHLPIQLGDIVLDYEFTVLPSGAMSHSVLLGSNFFIAHNISVDIAKQRLAGVNSWGSWEFYFHRDPKTVFRRLNVQVKHEVLIPWEGPVKVELPLPAEVKPLYEAEFIFDGNLLPKYLHGIPGLLSVGEEPLFILVYKVSGKHSQEKLQPGVVVRSLASLVLFWWS